MEIQECSHNACKRHQKIKDTITLGNQKANKAIKMDTESSTLEDKDLVQNFKSLIEILPKTVLSLHQGSANYTEEKIKWAQHKGPKWCLYPTR